MAEIVGHVKSIKFGGSLEKDNTEPIHTGAKSGGRCNDYGVNPIINSARKMDNHQWELWEIEKLKLFFDGKVDNVSLFNLLPHRSHYSIRHKANRLGFRYFRWEKIRTYDELSKEELAYIAGIIDGEGYIKNVKEFPCRQVKITVSNTNYELLQWLNDRLGGSITSEKRKYGNRKPCWQWSLFRFLSCINLLERIYPYLIVKRKVVEDIVWTYRKL